MLIVRWASLPTTAGRRHLAAQALGHLGGGVGVAAQQDDRKLLAAVARRQVDVPDAAVDDAGDTAQRVVAGAVAVALVERLELVEAAEQQRERPVVFAGAPDLLRQTLMQVAVVVEARETVGDRVELGATEPCRGGLEHGSESLRHVAAQAFHLGAADAGRRHVGLDDRDDFTLRVAHGREAAHPDAPLVDVEHVDVGRAAGEGLEQLVVGEDLAAQRRMLLTSSASTMMAHLASSSTTTVVRKPHLEGCRRGRPAARRRCAGTRAGSRRATRAAWRARPGRSARPPWPRPHAPLRCSCSRARTRLKAATISGSNCVALQRSSSRSASWYGKAWR